MPVHLAIGDFAKQIASIPGDHGVLHVGNIDVSRDFIDVEHIATLLCQLAEKADAQGIVNICSGQASPLRYLVDLLIYGCGRKIDVEIDWTRVRGNEPRVIVGSIDLLTKLGCPPPPTDLPEVMARVCRSLDKIRRGHGRAVWKSGV
jgi:GDP-4-dehydro-6-deoxy-D-mannose reductase